MASTVSAFSSLNSIRTTKFHLMSNSPLTSKFVPVPSVGIQRHGIATCMRQLKAERRMIVKAVDEETLIPEVAEEEQQQVTAGTEPSVSVPVSPSDLLKMFFQAEGTMNETAIPAVTKALEEIEDITNLKVQVLEGIASVELTKQTTVQATGVASSLVETIQGSGFKLQTLNLSFEDEEDAVE